MLTALPRRGRRRQAVRPTAVALCGVLAVATACWALAPAVEGAGHGLAAALAASVPAPPAAPAVPPRTPAPAGTAPGRACPGAADFLCITLQEPVDHFRAGSPTLPVTFALHRGTEDSRGVLVTATGGPGSSGIAVADGYTAAMSPEITDHYDLVFLDQRGTGLSSPFRCDHALDADEPADPTAASTAAERDAWLAGARRFVAGCLAEAGVRPADTGRYATRQAVEDLEDFRRWLGADRLTLYGESYGTEFQQAYAAAHPDHVAQLLLDGVVDTTTDPITSAAETARAYSDVLATTLTACDADSACAGDAPGGAVEAYDRLAASLRSAPRPYDFPLPDGGTEHRQLTAADLRAAASGAVSSRPARAAFQRALNAAVDGDLVPLGRLADDGDHPGAGSAEVDEGFSWGLYYAVECADRRWVPAGSSPRRQLDTWLAAAARAGVDGERLGQVFYGDLPCLVWPGASAAAAQPRVAPAVPADPPYPVLLLTADTDPNTPTANALRVFARARADTALVLLTGGPHVVYGWGYGCVDDVVTGVVTSGRLPARPETVCTGPVAEGYQPAPPATAAGWTTARHSLDLVAAAILGDSTYQAWDGGDPFSVGCDAGGTARYASDAGGTVHVVLDGCALTPGVPLDGSLEVTDGGRGEVSATLRLPLGRLVLAADGTLSGTFRGRPAG